MKKMDKKSQEEGGWYENEQLPNGPLFARCLRLVRPIHHRHEPMGTRGRFWPFSACHQGLHRTLCRHW